MMNYKLKILNSLHSQCAMLYALCSLPKSFNLNIINFKLD